MLTFLIPQYIVERLQYVFVNVSNYTARIVQGNDKKESATHWLVFLFLLMSIVDGDWSTSPAYSFAYYYIV